MNVDTGELRMLCAGGPISEGFIEVPGIYAEEVERRFEKDAEERKRLRDIMIKGIFDSEPIEEPQPRSVFVDMKEDTPLTCWANEQRRHKAKTNKKQMAKDSRRRNRR